MTDQKYGLGAIPSPPDERDYPIEALYAALNVEPATSFPSTYASNPIPPILNQGSTPECVAYSTAGMKMFQDYADSAPSRWYSFDEDLFFQRIGGGPNGAVIRDALDQLLKVGYPLATAKGQEANHKIAAYYAVPMTVNDIKAAITAFGELIIGVNWPNSWFNPNADGTVPAPDYSAGGHAIRMRGWDDSKGLRVPNSWGPGWGENGEFFLPYKYLNQVFEVWKAPDQPAPPPPPASLYHWHVTPKAVVKIYDLDPNGLILPGWKQSVWGSKSSSAPCEAPVYRNTTNGKSGATTVKILAGSFKGKTVQVAPPGTFVS